MKKVLAGLAVLVACAAAAQPAHAYTLTPDEARFISIAETDGNYRFRGVQTWGSWANHSSAYTETLFQRKGDREVWINSVRNWPGSNAGGSGAPFGQPDANYFLTIVEWSTYYSVCPTSGDPQTGLDPWFYLPSQTVCFNRPK